MASTSIAPVTVTPSSKTPAARLLDLLAGWSAFVSEEEEAGPVDTVTAEEIGDLYQEAGGTLLLPDVEDVQQFVLERLLPVLLRK